MVSENNRSALQERLGIRRQYGACHTGIIGKYFFEGHIPAKDIHRLLKEKPDIKGLTVPGMPMGSPGMEGNRKESYQVLAVGQDGSSTVWADY
ncbi:MAG: metal-binding protein [SAR324 cluster bacterium]|nr:metal-binding protein [SAR324 cluster bacterium]